MKRIKTVLADSQRLFTEGLASLLQKSKDPTFEIVNVVSTASELQFFLAQRRADLLFLELNLPDEDGLAILPEIRNLLPSLRICVLSSYGDYKFVKESLQKGADGFVTKKHDFKELMKCTEEIMLGNTFLAPGLQITPSLIGRRNGITADDDKFYDRFLLKQRLTKREKEILELITKAMNNKEIAKKLFISDQTVGVHRKNIMRKLGVRNTVNLIKFAIDHQLV